MKVVVVRVGKGRGLKVEVSFTKNLYLVGTLQSLCCLICFATKTKVFMALLHAFLTKMVEHKVFSE